MGFWMVVGLKGEEVGRVRGDGCSPDSANNVNSGTVGESGWGFEKGSVTELGGRSCDTVPLCWG